MRVDGYIRVSRVAGREGETFISPADQRARIRSWAKARGVEVAAFHEDLDFPGSHAERPGLKRAMERTKDGTVAGLVVARIDRFGRSAVDNARLLDEIRAAGGVLYTVAEGIDTSGPMGEFMAAIFTAFAQLELARIRDNWSAARSNAVSRGVHVASRTPTGYLRRDDGRLEPDPSAIEPIRRVFRGKAAGASWRSLGRILEDAGVRTPYGAENWTNRSLTHLISNRVYLGEARSGEFVMPDAHPAIVDERAWELAQRTKRPRSAPGDGALLSGLLRCAGCRFVLKPDFMRDRDGSKLRIYRCRGTRAAGKCLSPASALGRVIEPWVVERFMEHLGDIHVAAVRASKKVRELEEATDAAERELIAYRDSAAADILGDAFIEGLRVRAAKLDASRRALEVAREAAGGIDLPEVSVLRETWDDLTLTEQRHLLSLGFDAIFLRSLNRRGSVPIEDRVLAIPRGEGPDDLPGPGRRVSAIRSFDWSP